MTCWACHQTAGAGTASCLPRSGVGVPSASEGSRGRGLAKPGQGPVSTLGGADAFCRCWLGDQGSAATWSSAGAGGRGRWGNALV